MTETYIPWATRRPGPWAKTGYPSASTRTLAQIEGEVKHSMEGSLQAGFGELDKLTRQASWHFSISKIGLLYQHYPLEAVCWHAGGPGDMQADTALIGNLTLIGVEHEGVAGEPLTPAQLATTIRLSEDVRGLCPLVGMFPPTLRRNLWEHGWLSQTACPSGRIPWPTIIAALMAPVPPAEEDDLTPEESAKLNTTWQKVEEMYPKVSAIEASLKGGTVTLSAADVEKIAKRVVDLEAERLKA
jgi:hypothetical protein